MASGRCLAGGDRRRRRVKRAPGTRGGPHAIGCRCSRPVRGEWPSGRQVFQPERYRAESLASSAQLRGNAPPRWRPGAQLRAACRGRPGLLAGPLLREGRRTPDAQSSGAGDTFKCLRLTQAGTLADRSSTVLLFYFQTFDNLTYTALHVFNL